MTGKGGDLVWSRRTGMRPLGSRRRNQSFFCSLVMMLLEFVRGLKIQIGGRGGGNVHESCSPFCTVDFVELFEHDLYLLAIGRVLGDEVKTLGDHC